MVTWFKARCAGGGNVTFGVYMGFAPYGDVCAAFCVTIDACHFQVVMTAHA